MKPAVLTDQSACAPKNGVRVDATQQAWIEERLTTLAWMESLSLLTRGIAHDFNNVLAGVLSLSETVATSPNDTSPDLLSLLRDTSARALGLVRQLRELHLARPGQRAYHDLNTVAAEAVELIRKAVPKTIRVETDFAEGQIPVYFDAVEFQRVFIGLALDQAPLVPRGGQLRVVTSRQKSFDETGCVVTSLSAAPAACLTLQRNGPPLAPTDVATMAGPFLGGALNVSPRPLYPLRLFARDHSGALTVQSSENALTVFNLWLPEMDLTPDAAASGGRVCPQAASPTEGIP